MDTVKEGDIVTLKEPIRGYKVGKKYRVADVGVDSSILVYTLDDNENYFVIDKEEIDNVIKEEK